MNPQAWRGVLLTLCVVTALVTVASVLDVFGAGGSPPWYGQWGLILGVSEEPYHLTVIAVDSGGPAYSAGIRKGDLLDIRPNTLYERLEGFYGPLNGRPVTLTIGRGALTKHITIVPGPMIDPKLRLSVALGAMSSIWLLLFAAVITWRRAFVPGNLLLSGVLVSVAGVSAVSWGGLITPWAWPYVAVVIYSVFGTAAFALWAAFAGNFGKPLSGLRRAVQWMCYAFVAISCASVAATLFGVATLQIDPVPLSFSTAWAIPWALAVFAAVASGVLAIAASRGAERQRAVWSIVPLSLLFVLVVTSYFATFSQTSYAGSALWTMALVLGIAIMPVVLTYAAVSRRLIDIGFVLNRTVVFAIVSTIVIGAFVLVEWTASAWFVGATHTTSSVVGLVVALALGLSLRYIHRYVERFVDHVFFRKRYEDEAALRRFAYESSYITDRSILLERAIETVKKHTGADEATIVLRDAVGSYVPQPNGQGAAVSENDPAMLALRAWHKPVDISSFDDTALHGQFAFPMVSRGELVGVLTCGTKRDSDVYAPDESDALFALAQGVGAALGVLSPGHAGSFDSIAEKLDALRAALERQESVLRELRPSST
jgi:hypothetical protein